MSVVSVPRFAVVAARWSVIIYVTNLWNQMLELFFENEQVLRCESVIIIPEKAVVEPGYIQVFTAGEKAHAKHEYHAIAQVAYYQYQDDELEVMETSGGWHLQTNNGSIELENTLILCRDEVGSIKAVVHRGLNKKRLLEAGYRYCARWVRLDI